MLFLTNFSLEYILSVQLRTFSKVLLFKYYYARVIKGHITIMNCTLRMTWPNFGFNSLNDIDAGSAIRQIWCEISRTQ